MTITEQYIQIYGRQRYEALMRADPVEFELLSEHSLFYQKFKHIKPGATLDRNEYLALVKFYNTVNKYINAKYSKNSR